MKIELLRQNFDLRPERTLYWQEMQTLICSDLHWGRESFLQRFGMAIPETSVEKEIIVLNESLKQTHAKELWILGDFIHHPKGLHPELLVLIRSWLIELEEVFQVRVKLVPGNHDREVRSWSAELPLKVEETGIHVEGFSFLHEPTKSQKSQGEFTWSGHLHPAVQLPGLFGNKKVPCFYIKEKEAFLPAFSRLAGGFEIQVRSPREQIYAVLPDEVLRIPH